jgi:hypothetical protein
LTNSKLPRKLNEENLKRKKKHQQPRKLEKWKNWVKVYFGTSGLTNKSSESIYLPLCHPGHNNNRRFFNYSALTIFHYQFPRNVQDSSLNQDPLLRKNAFLSMAWIPAIRMEHVRAPSKGLSTRNVFCIEPMVICACGLLINPAKVLKFQYRAWLFSMDLKFYVKKI